jgi:hypothetical protein
MTYHNWGGTRVICLLPDLSVCASFQQIGLALVLLAALLIALGLFRRRRPSALDPNDLLTHFEARAPRGLSDHDRLLWAAKAARAHIASLRGR